MESEPWPAIRSCNVIQVSRCPILNADNRPLDRSYSFTFHPRHTEEKRTLGDKSNKELAPFSTGNFLCWSACMAVWFHVNDNGAFQFVKHRMRSCLFCLWVHFQNSLPVRNGPKYGNIITKNVPNIKCVGLWVFHRFLQIRKMHPWKLEFMDRYCIPCQFRPLRISKKNKKLFSLLAIHRKTG